VSYKLNKKQAIFFNSIFTKLMLLHGQIMKSF